MKISPLENNIHFGYDKKLNKRLKERLNEGNHELYSLFFNMNTTCNQTEDLITALEKQGVKDNCSNKMLIDRLLTYFIDAKIYLCDAIDSLFPELNFSKLELENYKKEQDKIDGSMDVGDYVSTWRDEIIEELEGAGARDDGADELSAEAGDTILERFIPFSYSPKSLDDVVGLKYSKERIEDLVIFPLSNPEKAKKRKEDYGIDTPGFILFYGPPGCGKTMLAEAISAQTGCQMFNLNIARVGLPYINVTTTRITKAFEEAAKAAKEDNKPVILFLDEADTFLRKRTDDIHTSTEDTKAINTLLPLIAQAKEKNIVVIAATNMYSSLDAAAKRRADLSLYIGLPDKEDIKKLLIKELSKFKMGKNLAQNEEELEALSASLKNYSPAVIVNVVKAASGIASKQNRALIKEDMEEALKKGDWTKINEAQYLPDNKKPSSLIGFKGQRY